MDLSKPYVALLPGVDGDVLAVLAGSTRARTGREIARLAERSKTAVQRVLDRLVEHGVVERQKAGEAFLYTLNREHVLSPIVERLTATRVELFDRLGKIIEAWTLAPVHASVFGSAARGDGDRHSDIDLLIVRPDSVDNDDPNWRKQIDALVDSVRLWTGNHAAVAEVSAHDLPRLRDEQPPVVAELRQDAVDLAGQSIRRLLGR
jgi:predicted nucleotidyltransferase